MYEWSKFAINYTLATANNQSVVISAYR